MTITYLLIYNAC